MTTMIYVIVFADWLHYKVILFLNYSRSSGILKFTMNTEQSDKVFNNMYRNK